MEKNFRVVTAQHLGSNTLEVWVGPDRLNHLTKELPFGDLDEWVNKVLDAHAQWVESDLADDLYESGYSYGYDNGVLDAKDEAFDDGFREGRAAGYDEGYTDGINDSC